MFNLIGTTHLAGPSYAYQHFKEAPGTSVTASVDVCVGQ